MTQQNLVNLLFGVMKNFNIGHFYIYLNLNRKILIALATFNKNDHMNVVIRSCGHSCYFSDFVILYNYYIIII